MSMGVEILMALAIERFKEITGGFEGFENGSVLISQYGKPRTFFVLNWSTCTMIIDISISRVTNHAYSTVQKVNFSHSRLTNINTHPLVFIYTVQPHLQESI